MNQQRNPEHTEKHLKNFLFSTLSSVVWNQMCLYGRLLDEIRASSLHPIDIKAFMNKMVSEGSMVQINIHTNFLGPAIAYLVGGKVTGVVDNANHH
jgi:hypothetical protein